MRHKKISQKQIGVTQRTIELDLKNLNIVTIREIIYENSSDVIKAKLQKNDVKCWCIFEFIMVKNEGKSDEEVFPIYFNTSAEQIFLESYFEIVTSWAEFAIASLDECVERGSGAKFLLLQTANLFIAEYKSIIGKKM